jgi:4-amino-4-deoxy-L-arabinose transferase-like glycosyltransferase
MSRFDARRAWPLFAILLFAAALRLYGIGAQSLWYDEGNSARIAERSVALIVEGAAGDIHPPLYYLLLKLWRAVFGASEAGLRSLSAATGIGAVAFTYLLGRDLANRRAGLIAAGLLALAPFAVYYSQEARMYALLALCASASSWALARWLRAPDKPFGALLVLATAAGLWTQYAYPFVMLAQGLWTLGAAWATRQAQSAPRLLTGYALINVIALAVYAPWAPIALRQIRGWAVEAQRYTLPDAAIDAYRWLAAGRTIDAQGALAAMLLIAALALIGLLAGRASLIDRGALFLLCALPLALLFVFGLYRDAYLKVLLLCVAPLMTLTALGIDALAARFSDRRAQWAIALATCAAIAAAVWPALRNQYANPAYARDDYRGIYQSIQRANPDSAVIFNAPNQWEVYTYYQGGDRGLHPLRYRPGSAGEAAQQLERIVFGQPDVFVLYYAEREADPQGWYEAWLATNAFKIGESWVGNIRLARYVGSATLSMVAQDVAFGDALIAEHVEADLSRGDGVVPVAITWRARRKLDARYKVFLHVGAADAPPVAQNDSEPATPTVDWPAGQPMRDLRGVHIAPDAQPGPRDLFLGVYDATTGERVGERVRIGSIEARP